MEIDLEQRRVYADGQPVRLTDIEFRLLACLAKQPGRVLTYQQILAQVWGWQEGRNHHYVHVHISRLRQKLEKDPKNPQYLLTEHGICGAIYAPSPFLQKRSNYSTCYQAYKLGRPRVKSTQPPRFPAQKYNVYMGCRFRPY